jgi:hypothetical protein
MGLTRGQAFPSRYIGKEDVLTNSIVATIKIVLLETVKGDGGDEDKVVLHFSDNTKPMICNNTNWSAIEDAYGPDSDGWIGKSIEIYHDPGITFGGKRTGGIRIRIPAKTPMQAAQPQASTAAAPAGLSWADAIEMAYQAGLSKESLIEALKARGMKAYNSVKDESAVREIVADVNKDIPF